MCHLQLCFIASVGLCSMLAEVWTQGAGKQERMVIELEEEWTL